LKLDTSGLDRETLVGYLRAEYGVQAGSLAFLPKGEDSFNFVVDSAAGERFLLRLQRPGDGRDLERSLSIAAALRDSGGLASIVAARPTRYGTLTAAIESYRIALFPYMEGETAWVRTPSDDSFARLGALLAEIHAGADAVRALDPPRASFANRFRRPIADALAWARDGASPTGPRSDDLRRLLLTEAADLTAFMDGFDDLGKEMRTLSPEFVITHGDPNLDNVIVAPDGNLHLIDWGEVALGPRERDLSSYADDRLDLVLLAYFEAAGSPPVQPDRFRFYRYRWCLQEIADYTTRIIFTNAEPLEDEHAWTELQPYLPVPHKELTAGHERTAALLSTIQGA